MKHTLILLLFSCAAWGQISRDDFLIQIGKYSFRPSFVLGDKLTDGRVFEPGDDGDLKEYIVYFPMRSDSFIVSDATEEKRIQVKQSNSYSIERFIDSINKNYIDTLINNEVIILWKLKKQKVLSLTFGIMFPDGKRVFQVINSNKINTVAKLLKNKKPYSYILLTDIQFYSDTKKKLSINDLFGWKIKGSSLR